MAKSFVLIDESKVNSYGFRTMVDGVDLVQFKKNPIMLWMHNRAFRGIKDEILPIGRWENIRVEGEPGKRKLLADPVFDEKDPFALSIKQKVDDGFIRMASAGLEDYTWSDAIEYKLKGQTRLTLLKSRLSEGSIVDIGSDDGALALYKNGQLITLAAGGDNPEIPIFNNNEKADNHMKTIALKLGLPETATEQEILDKISTLQTLQTENVTLKNELETIKLSRVTSIVENAIAEKRITTDKKEHFINLGKSVGAEQLKETLSLIPSAVKPTDVLHLNRGGNHIPGATSEAKKLSDLNPAEMIQLRKENPEEYKNLYIAEYGIAPRFEE